MSTLHGYTHSTTATAASASGWTTCDTPIITGARILAPDDGCLPRLASSVHPLRVGLTCTGSPLSYGVEIAVVDIDTTPESGDWETATYEAIEASSGEWVARLVVGPLESGDYAVWVRLDQPAGDPVLIAGSITVV